MNTLSITSQLKSLQGESMKDLLSVLILMSSFVVFGQDAKAPEVVPLSHVGLLALHDIQVRFQALQRDVVELENSELSLNKLNPKEYALDMQAGVLRRKAQPKTEVFSPAKPEKK
jgi:hypothetical protein